MDPVPIGMAFVSIVPCGIIVPGAATIVGWLWIICGSFNIVSMNQISIIYSISQWIKALFPRTINKLLTVIIKISNLNF